MAVIVVVAAVAAAFVVTRSDDTSPPSAPPTEVLLEPTTSIGPDPFTDSVAAPPPASTVAPPPFSQPTTSESSSTSLAASTSSTSAAPTPPPAPLASITGTAPGLYGGTRNQSSCDKARLISFLEANPDKARAFAAVQSIDATAVRSYVNALTPVLLQADTRVTNHGFARGRPTPRQTVLQAGTAVLVDQTGMPRVRCACGNPLLAAQPASRRFTGPSWPGFDPDRVQAITPGAPTRSLALRSVEDGEAITRPVGTDGGADARSSIPATTTTPPTTTRPTTSTTVTGPGDRDITRLGSIKATSTAPGFPAALAVDGDPATSWFDDGLQGTEFDNSGFFWTLPGDRLITSVTVVGNGQHPTFRTGSGWTSIRISVHDSNDESVFSEERELPGSPDPDLTVTPNVRGTNVVVLMKGHESRERGGFSELRVLG